MPWKHTQLPLKLPPNLLPWAKQMTEESSCFYCVPDDNLLDSDCASNMTFVTRWEGWGLLLQPPMHIRGIPAHHCL